MNFNMPFFLALFFATAAAFANHPVGIRLSFDPPTLDWNLGDVPIHVMNNVIEGLYSVNEHGKLVSNEAESLPRRTGPATWTIRLRTDLKWSDGKPVHAADYVFSWTRLLDPKTASTYPHLLADLKQFSARGDRDIDITTKEKKTLSPSVFTHWATFPMRADDAEKHVLFNGPYAITQYKPDVKIEMKPNKHHRRPGKLDEIDAWIIHDDATALRLYESGRIHFMPELAALDQNRLSARADYHSQASAVLVYLGLDTSHPELRDPALREALSAAIDRQAIPKILSAPHVPTSGVRRELVKPVKPTKKTHDALSGKNLEFAYFEKGTNRTLVEFIQAEWKKNLGLQTSLHGDEVKTYWTKLANKPSPIFLNSFGPPVWDQAFYFSLFKSDNPMNMGRWKNPHYDAAVESGNRALAARILKQQMPVIPLYFRSYEYLMSPKLKGAVLNPMTSLYLGQARLEN